MIHLKVTMAVISITALIFGTIGYARGCDDRQTEINGRCCNMCPPGTYMEEFCSENSQSICRACKNGTFSHDYNIFDRCEPCQSCQQYAEKCTQTTNAVCTCVSGFLCSNNICTSCVENKCVTGEKLNKTVTSSGVKLNEYSYYCEPLCRETEYFDVNEGICKPRIQCSAFGLAEKFPGNKTHNSICDIHDMQRDDGGFIYVILAISIILLSLNLLLFMSYTCIKNLRKQVAIHKTTLAVSTNVSDFHLPKEESGLQFVQDEFKDSDSLTNCIGKESV